MKTNTKQTIYFIALLTFFAFVIALSFKPETNLNAQNGLQTNEAPRLDENPADLFEASQVASERFGVPYGLLLGIAKAESSLGTAYVGCESSFNAWGVKAKPGEETEPCNRYLKRYSSWLEGAEDVAQILKTYYLGEEKTTPELIVGKYVGRYSTAWVSNVREFYNP